MTIATPYIAVLLAAYVAASGCSTQSLRSEDRLAPEHSLAVDLGSSPWTPEHVVDLPGGIAGTTRLFVRSGISRPGYPTLHFEPPETVSAVLVSKTTAPDWSSTWIAYDREKCTPFSEPNISWFEFWLTPRCDAPLRIFVDWRDSTDAHSASPSSLHRFVASSLPSGATP